MIAHDLAEGGVVVPVERRQLRHQIPAFGCAIMMGFSSMAFAASVRRHRLSMRGLALLCRLDLDVH